MRRRFRSGLVTGFAVGYVLGTRAGRERYLTLQRRWGQIRSSKVVQGAVGAVRPKIARSPYPEAEQATAPPGREAELSNLKWPAAEA